MTARWFVAKGNQKSGPFSFAELQSKVAGKQLEPNDMVLREGESKWLPAASIDRLFVPLPLAGKRDWQRHVTPARIIVSLFLVLLLGNLLFVRETASLREQLVRQRDGGDMDLGAQLEKARAENTELRKRLDDFTKESPTRAKGAKPSEVLPEETASDRPDEFAAIDKHALAAPAEAERSIVSLAKYLVEPAGNDRDKARAIYRWLTDRIAYNAADFLAGRPVGDCSAVAVLKSRLTVCEGYANLFQALGTEGGLKVAKVRGYSVGYGFVPGEKIATNHAWNAVDVAGQWHLTDATWGAGTIDPKLGFLKRFDDYYFLTHPQLFILNHFPDDGKWQLLDPMLGVKDFETRRARVDAHALQSLYGFGISQETLAANLDKEDASPFVKAYTHPGVRIAAAPLQKHLKAGTEYRFRVKVPGASGAALINNGAWQHLEAKNDVFDAVAVPKQGKLQLSARSPAKGGKYWAILEYVVAD